MAAQRRTRMKMLNLSIHAGAWSVQREQLAAVATPAPRGIWRPLAHKHLLDGVQGSLERAGLKVVAEAHALARDGDRYFGMLQLVNGHQAEDYSLVVGLRNAHDKRFPAGLVVGSGVFVCDNLAFSGEIKIARRHTTNLHRDLPAMIDAAVGRLGEGKSVV